MIRRLLTDLGYEPNQRFNALHGDTRLIFDDPNNKRSVDVFLEVFKMCHKLPIGNRLSLDELTIPITDLLLTKLQIMEANEKDIRDLTAIMRDHEVEKKVSPSERDVIDAGYIARLCSNEWGLQKTITKTLKKIPALLPRYGLDSDSEQVVRSRIGRLLEEIDLVPKSLKWKLRNIIGERKRWYELPEVPIRTS
jgi:hypothetical protein